MKYNTKTGHELSLYGSTIFANNICPIIKISKIVRGVVVEATATLAQCNGINMFDEYFLMDMSIKTKSGSMILLEFFQELLKLQQTQSIHNFITELGGYNEICRVPTA